MKVNIFDQQILKIALPAIVTNITVPLLGLVDTAIVGHMGSATYIAAIAVGSMIFNLIYWVFGFLRMGTSGMTAQAYGRKDFQEIARLLGHSLTAAAMLATFIILFQWPLRELMFWLMGATSDVRSLAVTYYHIVVWGAPAMLGLYGLSGWFIGMQNTRIPMVISILQNIANIFVSLWLVYGLGMKVEGLALGTVTAQYAGFLTAIALLIHRYGRLLLNSQGRRHLGTIRTMMTSGDFTRFFRVNRDIFFRTLCLVAVNLYFTSAGARQGATILAVNTLLMQLLLLFSYIMDGFAYAGEALGGRYWGAKDIKGFYEITRHLFKWGFAITLIFTLTYILGGTPFLQLLTDEPSVVAASEEYIWWAYLMCICGVTAFLWDGIFIGTTQTKGMLLSAIIATIAFFLTATTSMRHFGNHGLWTAMLLFLLLRGVVQTVIYWQRYVKIHNS